MHCFVIRADAIGSSPIVYIPKVKKMIWEILKQLRSIIGFCSTYHFTSEWQI